MLKIKKKIFEKEMLDIGMKIVILDMCEVTSDGENLIYDFSRMYWVLPTKLQKVVPLDKVKIVVEAEK